VKRVGLVLSVTAAWIGIAASINAPNTADTTNCLEIVKLLLDHGADPLLTVALLRHLIGKNGTGAQGPAPAAE
jgi:hypothetical protein